MEKNNICVSQSEERRLWSSPVIGVFTVVKHKCSHRPPGISWTNPLITVSWCSLPPTGQMSLQQSSPGFHLQRGHWVQTAWPWCRSTAPAPGRSPESPGSRQSAAGQRKIQQHTHRVRSDNRKCVSDCGTQTSLRSMFGFYMQWTTGPIWPKYELEQ